MEFITDRNYADVERVEEFKKRGWKNLDDEEKQEWLSEMKGALNYKDLNRIQDNALEIYSEYLRQNYTKIELTETSFIPQEMHIVAILSNGNKGYMYSVLSPSEHIQLEYGINIIDLKNGTINHTYVLNIDNVDNIDIFETYSQLNEPFLLKYDLFHRGELISRSKLIPTFNTGNYLGNLIKRPSLNSYDYRGISLYGTIINFDKFDYNTLNEQEKSLELSYNWVYNKNINMPIDWDITDTEIVNKYLLSTISQNCFIDIKMPKGFYLKIIFGIASHGVIVSDKKEMDYITDDKGIRIPSYSEQYSYEFNISNYYVNEQITLTTLVNSSFIKCNIANKLMVNINSGNYSTYVLYVYDNDKNLIKTIGPCNFGTDIDISKYYYIQIMVPGSGGLVDITYQLKNDTLNNFTELNIDDIEIEIKQ